MKMKYFKSVANKIQDEFIAVGENEIYCFKIFPSDSPVFIENNNEKEFFVRLTASSVQYKDIKEITNYCISKWGNENSND